jgi:hypothetical protein
MNIDLQSFSRERITVGGATVYIRRGGRGPAVLLLHGQPETHLGGEKLRRILPNRSPSWLRTKCIVSVKYQAKTLIASD